MRIPIPECFSREHRITGDSPAAQTPVNPPLNRQTVPNALRPKGRCRLDTLQGDVHRTHTP